MARLDTKLKQANDRESEEKDTRLDESVHERKRDKKMVSWRRVPFFSPENVCQRSLSCGVLPSHTIADINQRKSNSSKTSYDRHTDAAPRDVTSDVANCNHSHYWFKLTIFLGELCSRIDELIDTESEACRGMSF